MSFVISRVRATCSTVLCALALSLSACAQSKVYTPRLVPIQAEIRGLPADRVTLEINDFRAERSASDSMTAVLKSQIERALGRSHSGANASKYRLLVDIVEHRSFFTLGNWNAETRFRARLLAPDGNVQGSWDAAGSARRSNMGGYETAIAVAQDSYAAAVADLLSSLNTVILK